MATTTSRLPAATTNGDASAHDPQLVEPAARIPSVRQRRGTIANDAIPAYLDGSTYLPPAPEAPRGPPISYRPNAISPARRNDGIRSFSARTQDMSFKAGFSRSEDDVNNRSGLRNDNLSRVRPNGPKRSATQTLPSNDPTGSTPLSHSNQAESVHKSTETVSQRESEGGASSISRSSTLRSVKGERRDWAPDRSPLQRLEVTLHGISKEEKRARVLEAEMRLREQIARRASQREGREAIQSAPEKPNSGDSPRAVLSGDKPPAFDRSSSDKERDFLSRNDMVASKRLESRRVSTSHGKLERQGDQYVAQQPAATLAEVPGNFQYAAVQTANQPQFVSTGDSDRTTDNVGIGESESGHHARTYSLSNSFSHSLPQGANSSHGAALADPLSAGVTMPAAIGAVNGGKMRAGRLNYEYPRPSAPSSQQNISRKRVIPELPLVTEPAAVQRSAVSAAEQAQTLAGLGLNYGPDEQQELPKDDQLDVVVESKRRRHTVSFDVPPPTPPLLSEWKQASVARLRLTDMDFQLFDADKGKAWWERSGVSNRRQSRALPSDYNKPLPKENPVKSFQPPLFLRCGPLLRYAGLKRSIITRPSGSVEQEIWRGSILIVTKDSQSSYELPPTLRLFFQPMDLLPPPPARVSNEAGSQLNPEYVDPTAGLTKIGRAGQPLYVKPVDHINQEIDLSLVEDDNGLFEESPSPIDYGSDGLGQLIPGSRIHSRDGEKGDQYREVPGFRLYADSARDVTFWRFNIEVELGDKQERVAYRINQGPAVGFWVPARGQSMNIMFYSCNGFSLSVDSNKFSGPDPLWRDVLNEHQTRPFHVMIGGGDQIYNDKVILNSKLFQAWTQIKNPHQKYSAPFNAALKAELETCFLEQYLAWFSKGLFSLANCQIPMINIWDDHDIIDGFGSYPHHLMITPVFSGLGNVAFKYYMLFQHQSTPEETEENEPSWLLGQDPGPYVNERSRSLFMFLGKGVAFLGLDCRTERMRDEILSDHTYERIWDRCHREIVKGETKHLIVLTGVPVAYPRLVWLENLLTSRVMDPIKVLSRVGVFSGMMNKFDGGIEILDDLDDHWTAKKHKLERTFLIEDLQDLAAEKSIRVTILSGDVHLAAIGQFYSNPRLNLAKDKDYRYMPNVISSAIANAPPPELLSDILNKRNKIHHLDSCTDEDMIPIFTHDVDTRPRNNKRLLPRRNWCSIREYNPGSTPPPTPPEAVTPPEDQPPSMLTRTLSLTRGDNYRGGLIRRLSLRGPPPTKDFNLGDTTRRGSVDGPHPPARTPNGSSLPQDEPPPGPFHRRPTNLSQKAARKATLNGDDGVGSYVNLEGGLDITLHLEVSSKDPSGITTPYKLLVPALWYEAKSKPQPTPVVKGWKKWLPGSKKTESPPSNEPDDQGEERADDGVDGDLSENQDVLADPPLDWGAETAPAARKKFLGII